MDAENADAPKSTLETETEELLKNKNKHSDTEDDSSKKSDGDSSKATVHAEGITTEEEDEAESDGGVVRTRVRGKERASADSSRNRFTAQKQTNAGLDGMSQAMLVSSYTTYAIAHAMLLKKGMDSNMLDKFSAIRGEIVKRGILDILLPLLMHFNPFVQVSAAVDVLSSVFDKSSTALHILKSARSGGRGVLPLVAEIAIDNYTHAQLVPLQAPLELRSDAILREASNTYRDLQQATLNFNENSLQGHFPSLDRVQRWDGKEHTGPFISIGRDRYAQHTGREYQLYARDQLKMLPENGERYRVSRDGSLQFLSAREREVLQRGQRGKI